MQEQIDLLATWLAARLTLFVDDMEKHEGLVGLSRLDRARWEEKLEKAEEELKRGCSDMDE